jgi:hypothetical protein
MKILIKTKKQFKDDGLWNNEYDCPIRWNHQGKMNYLLGKTVEIEKIGKYAGIYKLKDKSGWFIYKDSIAKVIEE